MELAEFIKTKEGLIIFNICDIIGDTIHAIELAYKEKFDVIPITIRMYIKPRLEAIEKIVGERLEECRAICDDILYACSKRNFVLTETHLIRLAQRVCIESFQKLLSKK
jgi:hypothetical protein